jgi:hypothetical protein
MGGVLFEKFVIAKPSLIVVLNLLPTFLPHVKKWVGHFLLV